MGVNSMVLSLMCQGYLGHISNKIFLAFLYQNWFSKTFLSSFCVFVCVCVCDFVRVCVCLT